MINYFITNDKLDALGMIMIFLVAYIGICVIGFAARSMKGNARYQSFFFRMLLMIGSLGVMVSTDNIVFLLISASFSNLLLVTLMTHNSRWKAAKTSGVIAAKNYLLSACFMGSAFTLFYCSTGQTSINAITSHTSHSMAMVIALLLLLLAAMSQSGIWPFHKWLLSSLNSPTPVSAMMHAGLINGGGFLLARFSSLYVQNEIIMNILFIIGLISSLLGTLWKLLQHDVKRMLACSTMGQMGFMFAQCGLGLFPLAIAHLCWHGFFKAYLFLASSSAAQEKRLDFFYFPTVPALIGALFCGVLGSLLFAYISHKSWFAGDSTLVLLVLVFLAATQLSLAVLRTLQIKNFIFAITITISASALYGGSIQLIMLILRPMDLMHPQPLSIFHILGIFFLVFSWFCPLFIRNQSRKLGKCPSWLFKAYVQALNASQPHQETITCHRNHYQYQ